MRQLLVVLGMAVCSITSATAQVSVGIGLPGVSIGINLPVYPQLVLVPGYPVYYAPQLSSNYFFYDGMYWVYQRDNWYASSWYDGPWGLVAPNAVPLYVLRVPVRYYRQPPVYFRGWQSDAPPRWGEHWGNTWERSHNGWDHWNRTSVPAPAPLPVYQRQYSGARYPQAEQQQALQNQNYRYQPHDAVVQQHYQAQRAQLAPAAVPASTPQQAPGARKPYAQQQPRQADPSRGEVPPSSATYQRPGTAETPAARPAQHPTQQPSQGSVQRAQQAPGSPGQAKPAAAQVPAQHAQQSPQGAEPHDQPAPRSQGQNKGSQGKGAAQEQSHGQESGERQGR